MSTPIPIIVGQHQITNRVKTLEDLIHPIEFMKQSVEGAAEDAGTRSLIEDADALHIVNVLSWHFKDPPSELAEALGSHPRTREYTAVGGNNPQWLVNRVADRLVAGESEIAILTGCEVMKSFGNAMKQGKDIGAFSNKMEIKTVGIDRPGTTQIENEHFADRPVRVYPLIENALRYKEGLTLEQQREHLAEFGNSFSKVAARNEFAWFPIERSKEEIITPTPDNRMVSFPYTKYLNAVINVDMTASIIMTTTEKARALGIPEEKWVYVHGGQDAHELWHVSERPDLTEAIAIKACVDDSLAQADLTLDDIDFFDLYSCFPCMPRLTRHMLGMSHSDPRPMTITGGLPYFGGPGNNFVMHSIAEAVRLCRKEREKIGMITANGYYCTKHGVGVYSGQEPRKPWSRTSPEKFQSELPLPEAMEVDPDPVGQFTVEAYTVWNDRHGEPEQGILMGRTSEGKRAWAQVASDAKDTMKAMSNEEWCGRVGKITGKNGKKNIVDFS